MKHLGKQILGYTFGILVILITTSWIWIPLWVIIHFIIKFW